MITTLDNIDSPIDTTTITKIEDALAQHVRAQFIQAKRIRQNTSIGKKSIEERLLMALRARCYKYDPGDEALLDGIDIYIGVTDLKCRAATAWMNDTLLSSIDKPWILSPEPIPKLPDWAKEDVVNALQHELLQMGAPITNIRDRAKDLKDIALKYAQQKAQDAASKMENLIEDQLLEGGWRTAFAEFLDDLPTFPAAFLRMPIIKKEDRLVWDGNKLVEKNQVIYGVRRISPFDAYPSGDSSNTQNGRFFIERLRLQVDDLYSMLNLDGFNDEAIREVIRDYGDSGYQEFLIPDTERKILENKNLNYEENSTIDTLIFNGKVSGKLLIDNGVLVPDKQKYYEVEIWTVSDRTIKAVLNPYPLGQRPIFSSSFTKIPGSVWGKGLADILDSIQRSVNSGVRSIVRNWAYSSGPIGEVDVNRLGDGVLPDLITPYRLYHANPDPLAPGQRAFHLFLVPSVAEQIQRTVEYFTKLGDDHSGIPAYVLGNPNLSGAGRTAAGFDQMMSNAAKGIKNVILNVDRDAIEPGIGMFYNINMINSDDESIKVDAQIIARGATGLLQKEMAKSNISELLQVTLPLYQQGLIPKPEMDLIVRESIKGYGFPVDNMPDPNRTNQIQDALGRIGVTTALQRGTNDPMQLDGRSATPPFPQQNIPGPPPFAQGIPPSMPSAPPGGQ